MKKGTNWILKTIYIFLIVGIVIISIWDTFRDSDSFMNSVNSSLNPVTNTSKEAGSNKETTPNTKVNSNSSNEIKPEQKFMWTDYVVKPIVLNPINQVFFKIIFYLLILVSLFLIIPAGLATLKRFKLFQFEFELEKDEVKETIAELIHKSEGKANYIKELTKDDTYQTIVSKFVQPNGKVDFFEAISWFLSDMSLNYKENFDQNINWILGEVDLNNQINIIKQETSGKFNLNRKGMHLIEKAISENKIQSRNDDRNLFNIHYLIFPFSLEQKNYVIVVNDYKVGFGDLDETILESLFRIVRLSSQSIEYSILSRKLQEILSRNNLI